MLRFTPKPIHLLLCLSALGCASERIGDSASPPLLDSGGIQPTPDFSGEVRVDLQPGKWPNIIEKDDSITVAVLARNGFNPTPLTTTDLTLSNADRSIEVEALSDAGMEDVDGDDLDDHLFEFPYSAALFEGSGPVHIHVGELSATDHFVDDTRLTFVYPDLLGPFPIGTARFEWEDTSRPDDRTDGVAHRRLPVQIWYPANLPSKAQPTAHYLKREEGILIADYLGIFSRYFDYLFSHAHLDEPVSNDESRWPVLLFSHGYGVQLPNQTALVQNAASHGFVVVGVQHTYSTAYTLFDDNTVATAYINPANDTKSVQNMWTEDLRFVLDQVFELNATASPFENRLDLDRIGAFGYSFGGSTVSELCRTDERVLAGLNIDGTFYGDAEPALQQPFMLINAANNFEDDNREPFLNSLKGTAYNLSIPDARHANFNDYALQDQYISDLTGGAHGLPIGAIDSRLAYEIVHTYVNAFFSHHVTGDSNSLLSQESPWSEANFEVWGP